MLRPALLLLLSCCLAACPGGAPPAPALVAVAPDRGRVGEATPITVTGVHLRGRLRVDLDRPSQSTTVGAYAARLTGPAEVPLQQVTRLSDEALTAVVPAGQPAGLYALEVVDPWGRTATLADAFRVVDLRCQGEGTPCDDNDACTEADTCRGGVCGGAAVTCDDANDCTANACLPATGCVYAPVEGACADDGLTCTTDVCSAGVCTHPRDSASSQCLIDGACVYEGEPWPASSCLGCVVAANPTAASVLPAATICRGGKTECDRPERCDGTSPACPADAVLDAGVPCEDDENACSQDVCDGLGMCAHPPVGDGAPCADGNGCTGPDVCTAGSCGGPSLCASNMPPLVAFTAVPSVVAEGGTITFDPTATSDESPDLLLQMRWNFDFGAPLDTGYDTAWEPLALKRHTFSAAGEHTVALEVKDPLGHSDFATRVVASVAGAGPVWVTTLADENDGNATPANPKGSGLSLREAVEWSNRETGRRVIGFAPGLSGAVRLRWRLPAFTNPAGLAVIASPGVVLNGKDVAGNGKQCVVLEGGGHLLANFTLRNCQDWAVEDSSTGSQVRDCKLRKGGDGEDRGVWLRGAGARFGPGNSVNNFTAVGVRVAAQADVSGNRLRNNGVAVEVSAGGDDAVLAGNVVYENRGVGVSVVGASRVTIEHNTLEQSTSHGLALTGTGHVVRNNLVTNNGGNGVNAAASAFALQSHNLFFANTQANCSNCTPGPGSLTANPAYVARASDDFRLLQASPAIDAGTPTGRDVNGPLPGAFSGSAPDLGAWEAP